MPKDNYLSVKVKVETEIIMKDFIDKDMLESEFKGDIVKYVNDWFDENAEDFVNEYINHNYNYDNYNIVSVERI